MPRGSLPTRRTRLRPRMRWPPWPRPSAPTSACGRTPPGSTRCRTSWCASRRWWGHRSSLQAANHSLDMGEIVSSGPLRTIPGARRTTYFGSTTQAGVGQAITIRAGVYVDLLSFFSAASANAQPITPAVAERVAHAQHAAMVAAPGGTAGTSSAGAGKGLNAGSVGLAALVVAVIAAAVAAPALLRRRNAAPRPRPSIRNPTRRGCRGAVSVGPGLTGFEHEPGNAKPERRRLAARRRRLIDISTKVYEGNRSCRPSGHRGRSAPTA